MDRPFEVELYFRHRQQQKVKIIAVTVCTAANVHL